MCTHPGPWVGPWPRRASALASISSLALALLACGRVGFDPSAQLEGDAAVPPADAATNPDAGPAPGPLNVHPEVLVSAAAALPDCPAVAWTGSEFVIVWVDARDPERTIYGARVGPDGAALGPDFALAPTAITTPPAIVGNGAGFTMVWGADVGGVDQLHVGRFTGQGELVGAIGQVTGGASGSSNPDLIAAPQGYALSWQNGGGIVATLLDPTGARRFPDDARLIDNPSLSMPPSIVWTGTDYAITWPDESGGGGTQLFVARMGADGVKIGPEMQLTTDARLMLTSAVVWTGAESLAVWEDNRSGEFEIYGARIDPSGQQLGDDIVVLPGTSGGAWPAIAWSGTEAGLVLQSSREGDASVAIYMSRVSATGEVIGQEVRVSTSPDVGRCADIVWTGSQYGVAWQERQGEVESIHFARVSY